MLIFIRGIFLGLLIFKFEIFNKAYAAMPESNVEMKKKTVREALL